MATIRKRNGKWQAQVRRTGHAPRAQSFAAKGDAQEWARSVERELDRSLIPQNPRRLAAITVSELLTRYRTEVTPKKRGSASEGKRIEVFLREPWAALPLARVTAQVFARHRDQRLRQARPGTAIRELGLLRSIFETARREWDVPMQENPLALVKKPVAPEGRDRRLRDRELRLLLQECAKRGHDWLQAGILLAIETGMRRGELLNVRWNDIDFGSAVLSIPITKTGLARRIPLTDKAVELFGELRLENTKPSDRVFSQSANAFRLAWERCKRRVATDLPDVLSLRFHDLRHEAVSRFFELGLSTAEVALISGHRDMRMLFRYTHLKPEAVGLKLRQAFNARLVS